MSFDISLLDILVCPIARTPLRYDADRGELVSDASGLAYPIENGVPIMLADRARRLDGEPAQ